MIFRLVKQSNMGVIESVFVEFNSTGDCDRFCHSVNTNMNVPFRIIDYEKALVGPKDISRIEDLTREA